MDWQLMRILLYSGFAAVVVLLIYFGLYWSTPTAAQYWGLARGTDPAAAAAAAYEAGDHRFLTIQFDWQGANIENDIVGISGCWNHPAGEPIPTHENTEMSLSDSTVEDRLYDFALSYNATLAQLMNDELHAGCTIIRM